MVKSFYDVDDDPSEPVYIDSENREFYTINVPTGNPFFRDFTRVQHLLDMEYEMCNTDGCIYDVQTGNADRSLPHCLSVNLDLNVETCIVGIGDLGHVSVEDFLGLPIFFVPTYEEIMPAIHFYEASPSTYHEKHDWHPDVLEAKKRHNKAEARALRRVTRQIAPKKRAWRWLKDSPLLDTEVRTAGSAFVLARMYSFQQLMCVSATSEASGTPVHPETAQVLSVDDEQAPRTWVDEAFSDAARTGKVNSVGRYYGSPNYFRPWPHTTRLQGQLRDDKYSLEEKEILMCDHFVSIGFSPKEAKKLVRFG